MTFTDFQTTKFRPKDLDGDNAIGSCGVYALSYLTGIKSRSIDVLTPKKKWWSDSDMVKFLKSKGFQCIPINEQNIHVSKKPYFLYKNSINHLNVLLLSQHTTKEEGSWAVVHNFKYYHGHEIEFFSGYELVVNPFWTGYVIWHPKWKTPRSTLDGALKNTNIYIADSGVEGFNPYTGKRLASSPF